MEHSEAAQKYATASSELVHTKIKFETLMEIDGLGKDHTDSILRVHEKNIEECFRRAKQMQDTWRKFQGCKKKEAEKHYLVKCLNDQLPAMQSIVSAELQLHKEDIASPELQQKFLDDLRAFTENFHSTPALAVCRYFYETHGQGKPGDVVTDIALKVFQQNMLGVLSSWGKFTEESEGCYSFSGHRKKFIEALHRMFLTVNKTQIFFNTYTPAYISKEILALFFRLLPQQKIPTLLSDSGTGLNALHEVYKTCLEKPSTAVSDGMLEKLAEFVADLKGTAGAKAGTKA